MPKPESGLELAIAHLSGLVAIFAARPDIYSRRKAEECSRFLDVLRLRRRA